MVVVQTMDIDELRSALAPTDTKNYRSFENKEEGRFEIVPVDGHDKLRFIVGTQEYAVSREGYASAVTGVGYSKKLSEKPTDLIIPLINYSIEHDVTGRNQIGFLFDEVEGQETREIRKFLRGEYVPISDLHILDIVQEVAGTRELSASHISILPGGGATYSVVTSQETPLAVGDFFQAGVTIDNYSSVESNVRVACYLRRLICMNGATSTDNFRVQKRTGRTGNPDEWLRTAVTEAMDAIPLELDRLRNMREIPIVDAVHTLRDLFSVASVPKRVRSALMERAYVQQPATLYDVYNLITDLGSNDEDMLEDAELSQKLMRSGAKLALHQEMCTSCHRPLV